MFKTLKLATMPIFYSTQRVKQQLTIPLQTPKFTDSVVTLYLFNCKLNSFNGTKVTTQ